MSFFVSRMRSWFSRRTEKGFTLIELAIVLLIVGLLLAGFFAGLRVYMAQKKLDDTNNHIEEVRIALSDYVKNERPVVPGDPVRFPCPASLTIAEDDPGYMAEDLACRTMAAGTLDANGLWAVNGEGGTGVVVIGAVPTATLGIPARYGYDGYGNRLFYAVTQELTLNDALVTNTPAAGRVGIQRLDLTTGAPISETVDFLIFSPGRARQGAYSIGGVRVSDCVAGMTDGQNCAWQAGANAEFIDRRGFSLSTDTAAGVAAYYDDRLEYTLGADEEDRWWGSTEPGSSIDIFNQANTDNVIISGTTDRSQLIVNQTGNNIVELANRNVPATGAPGPDEGGMLITAGIAPSLTLENWSAGAGSARASRWYLGNPAGGVQDFVAQYTGPVGSGITDRSALEFIPPTATGPTSVRLGAAVDASNTTSFGTSLIFSGGAHENTDPISISRANVGNDITELRVSVGDNQTAGTTDAFVVGGTNVGAGGAWVERMRVRSDGNVGIGTQNPGYVLHVMSNATNGADRTFALQAREAAGLVGGRNSPGMSFLNNAGFEVAAMGIAGFNNAWANNSVQGDYVLRANGRDMLLATGLAPIWTPRLVIKNDGKIGIGTSAPTTSLDVRGSVRPGNQTLVTAQTCDATTAGAVRYNTGGWMEYCDGTVPIWKKMGAGLGLPERIINTDWSGYHGGWRGMQEARCPEGYVMVGAGIELNDEYNAFGSGDPITVNPAVRARLICRPLN